MTHNREIHEVLKVTFGVEYSTVGEDAVEELINGDDDRDFLSEGKKLDLAMTLALLGDGAALAAAALMTYDVFFLKNRREPTADELRDSLFSSLSEEEKNSLLARALEERGKSSSREDKAVDK